MTEYERELALALWGCRFLPGSSDKRFCRNMAEIAEHSSDKEISLRQRHYMEIMAWRYRRQMPAKYVPPSKPLDLPRKVKQTRSKSSPAIGTDTLPGIVPPSLTAYGPS